MRMRRTMPDQFGTYMMRNFTRFMVKVSILLYICMQAASEGACRLLCPYQLQAWHLSDLDRIATAC